MFIRIMRLLCITVVTPLTKVVEMQKKFCQFVEREE